MKWLFPAVLVLVLAGASVPQHTGKSGGKKSVSQLKNDLGKVHDKKSSLQKALSKTKKQVRQVKGDIRQLDSKISTVSEQLERTTNHLQNSRQEQTRLGGELAETTKRLEETRTQVRLRLRWMYTHENATVVSALFNSKDVSDIASKSFLLGRIAQADRRLFNDYVTLRAETASKKKRQDELVTEIAGLKRNQEGQKSELADTREDKAYALGGLVKKQKDLERLMRQLDAEEASITARISAYNSGAGRTSGLKPFTGRFSRPVNGPITSRYGMRFHPILHRTRMHAGIDFGASRGTPIHAAADGIVILSTYSQGYGNEVVVDHGGGISTLYGHCSRIFVSAGQKVTRGQAIAAVGATGLATGPHLHFEVRVNGRPVNPLGRL